MFALMPWLAGRLGAGAPAGLIGGLTGAAIGNYMDQQEADGKKVSRVTERARAESTAALDAAPRDLAVIIPAFRAAAIVAVVFQVAPVIHRVRPAMPGRHLY